MCFLLFYIVLKFYSSLPSTRLKWTAFRVRGESVNRRSRQDRNTCLSFPSRLLLFTECVRQENKRKSNANLDK